MSLASALGLDNEIALIRNRGFRVCEARTVGGPDGKFRVGSNDLDAAGIRALANRLADRWPSNPFLPRQQPQPKPKEQPVPDIFRGLTERRVRADLTTIRDEWGGPAKAAQVLGIGKSSLTNAIGGWAKIGNTVMDALYGPEGTTLRADIRKVKPTPTLGELSTESQVQGAYDAIVEATADIAPDVEAIDETPAGQAGEDAGSDLGEHSQEPVASPAEPEAPSRPEPTREPAGEPAALSPGADAGAEPALHIVTPEPGVQFVPVQPELAVPEAPWGGRVLPPWLATTLENLIDEELKIGEQVAQLTAQRAKIAKARELLLEVAA